MMAKVRINVGYRGSDIDMSIPVEKGFDELLNEIAKTISRVKSDSVAVCVEYESQDTKKRFFVSAE